MKEEVWVIGVMVMVLIGEVLMSGDGEKDEGKAMLKRMVGVGVVMVDRVIRMVGGGGGEGLGGM